MPDLASSVTQYCADIGKDRLLVQGAGGNVSWKQDGTLWIKASGTWLADAAHGNIFVPVDLQHLRAAVAAGNFSISPTLAAPSDFKPSIETLLHALMPHTVVVHLHAIEVLTHLVRKDCHAALKSLLANSVPWLMVDYLKPGAELAAAVHTALTACKHAQVVLLKNHGVVIGGKDVNEVRHILSQITSRLDNLRNTDIPPQSNAPADTGTALPRDYVPIADSDLHQLATNPTLFERLKTDWALYPDHVVFLGAHPHIHDSWEQLQSSLSTHSVLPELVFVRQKGVFVTPGFSAAKAVQLRCYYDVLVRQPQGVILEPIDPDQIADLLSRDDEKYRQNIRRSNPD